MTRAEITLIKIRMFLLDAEQKASDIYYPVLAELWKIIKEGDEDAAAQGSQTGEQGLQAKHPHGNQGGQAAKAGGGDRL